MNKRNYEEIIAADPSVDLDGLGLSAEDRAAAEVFRRSMRELDDRIAAALEIGVPEPKMPELPPVEGANVVHMRKPEKRRLTTPAWIGIAASFALVAVFAGGYFVQNESYPSLAAEVVEHLDHEPGSRVITSTPVAERRLASVVNENGVSVTDGLGLVTYARSCVINGKTVPHLVIQGRNGPVTLLLMPGEPVKSAVPLTGENINGVILPVGDGSIAIVGEKDENLEAIEKQVVDSVTWSI